jgi:outer membrane murein-binding lipoprotein Lpp
VTILNATVIATRSVASTLILEFILVYVFAIVFRSQIGNAMPDHFPSMDIAMRTLIHHAVFMDDVSGLGTDIWDQGVYMWVLYMIFIWVANLTLLNMLLGILVEVITRVAEAQGTEDTVTFMRNTLLEKLKQYDADYNGDISYEEFQNLIADKEVAIALTEIDVDIQHFKSLSEYLFEDPETLQPTLSVSFSELMEMTLGMQQSKTARVLDIVDLQKGIRHTLRNFMTELSTEVSRMDAKIDAVAEHVGADLSKVVAKERTTTSANQRMTAKSTTSRSKSGSWKPADISDS